jgi:hypothetical protein
METNPYEYDRALLWAPQQNQSQNQKLPQSSVGQKPGTQAKMPKARVLALANTLKRTLAVASMIGFGMFGGLVAMHQVSTTTTIQSTQSTSGTSNTSSKSNSSSQNNNNFLNQQGGNTGGTNISSSSSTTSTPVTGTSTS